MFQLIISIIGDIARSFLRLTRLMLILVSIVLLLVIVIIPLTLKGLGYYIASSGLEIGVLAIQKRDVSLCHKIWAYHILGPTTESRQASCVHKYAEAVKDPLSCKNIPNPLIRNFCIGASELPDQRWCWMDFKSTGTLLGRGEEEVRADQCRTTHHSNGLEVCCSLYDVILTQKASDCSQFISSPQLVQDQCYEMLAMRDRDAKICNNIVSENLRSSCNVRVR